MVSRNDIENAVIKFMRDDVSCNLENTAATIMVKAFATMLDRNRKMFDSIFDNAVAKAIEEEGCYDVDAVIDAVKDAIQTNGVLKVTLPAIPLVMPDDLIIMFGVRDVDKLRQYM